eukprot:2604654-Rhodomonas_salina.2
MMMVGFDLQPGGASTMMMPSGTKLRMSGGQSGQRLSMRGPTSMCVVTVTGGGVSLLSAPEGCCYASD